MAILLDSRSDISGLNGFWDKIIAEAKRAPKNVKKIAAKVKSMKKAEPAAATDQPSFSTPVSNTQEPRGMSTNTKIGIGLAGLSVVTLASVLIMKMRK